MIFGRSDTVRQAIDWHLRIEQADGGAWHAFVAWLEADEAHRDLYDRIARDDSLLMRRPKPMLFPAPEAARRQAPNRLHIAAVAAGIAMAIAGTAMLRKEAPGSGLYAVETGSTAVRSIMLDDGSRIDLNRNSRLVLDRRDSRLAMLDHGEAVFRIRHDPRAPFRVVAGSTTLQDIGTTFDVIRERGRLDVAVAEGGVLFQPAHEAIALKPGMMLSLRGSTPVVEHIPVASVGDWQRNRIAFRNAALADVAADAGRLAGTRIAIAPSIAHQRLSGTLRSDAGAAEMIARLAALTGSRADRRGDGWLLTADGGSDH